MSFGQSISTERFLLIPTGFVLNFTLAGWTRYVRNIDDQLEVQLFPINVFRASNVQLEPGISLEVLFGEEEMGDFSVSGDRLRETNNFVRKNDVYRHDLRASSRRSQIPEDFLHSSVKDIIVNVSPTNLLRYHQLSGFH